MIQNSQKLKMTQVLITLCVSRQWSTVPIKKKKEYIYILQCGQASGASGKEPDTED